MKVKELIANDLSVFLNVEEFGEVHIVDNTEIECVFLQHLSQKSGAATKTFEGLYGDFSTLYFKTGELPSFHEGESVRIDRNRYTVEFVEDQIGITKLTLSSYRQRRI